MLGSKTLSLCSNVMIDKFSDTTSTPAFSFSDYLLQIFSYRLYCFKVETYEWMHKWLNEWING